MAQPPAPSSVLFSRSRPIPFLAPVGPLASSEHLVPVTLTFPEPALSTKVAAPPKGNSPPAAKTVVISPTVKNTCPHPHQLLSTTSLSLSLSSSFTNLRKNSCHTCFKYALRIISPSKRSFDSVANTGAVLARIPEGGGGPSSGAVTCTQTGPVLLSLSFPKEARNLGVVWNHLRFKY